MAREIKNTCSFTTKLIKMVPTEILGAYMALSGSIGFDPTMTPTSVDVTTKALITVVFFALLGLTPVYLRRITGVRNKTQLLVTSASFVVWVYTLGGPFVAWGIYHQKASTAVLVLWSLTIPIIVRPQETHGSQPLPEPSERGRDKWNRSSISIWRSLGNLLFATKAGKQDD
jgi:hypothetical protein